MAPAQHIRITQFLKPQSSSSDLSNPPAALIVLNSPISDLDLFRRLYNHSSFRLFADGGANRVFDLINQSTVAANVSHTLKTLQPDEIHGDLDSLRDDVRHHYARLGVAITRDGDQYSTDFGKAVKLIRLRLPDVQDVLILGSIGGRVDQGIGLLHELYREQVVRHPAIRFWLLTEASVSVILGAGTTTMDTCVADGLIRESVGILPLYGPATISTKGLEWDVQNWPTAMGQQVSTSNHVKAEQISITTDREVVFTIERSTAIGSSEA